MLSNFKSLESKKHRKRAYAQLKPCIFCGGNRKATTEDHIPSRCIFTSRHWPEDFSFPACINCQKFTAKDEVLIRFVSYMFQGNNPPTEKEIKDAVLGFEQNFPHLKWKMADQSAKQKYILEKGLKTEDLPMANMPWFDLSDAQFQKSLSRFGFKLGCALFYHHHGKIVPGNGMVFSKFRSNLQYKVEGLTEEIREILNSAPKLRRNNKTLNNQFHYEYAIDDEKQLGIFVSYFRQSFVILNLVSTSPELIPEKNHEGWVKPKTWRK